MTDGQKPNREMSVEQVLGMMSKELGKEPHVMRLLSELLPEMVFEHAHSKRFAYSGGEIPAKHKALISVAVAAALGSGECSVNQTRLALGQGCTAAEIVEAMTVARFVKASTVFSAAEEALSLLDAEEGD